MFTMRGNVMWTRILSFFKLLGHLFTGLFVKNYHFALYLSGASETSKSDVEALIKNLSFNVDVVEDEKLANVVINSSTEKIGLVIDAKTGVSNVYIPIRNGRNDKVVDLSVSILSNALSFFGRFM